jgi:hypothetical protein
MGKRKRKPPKHRSGKDPLQGLPPLSQKQSKSLVWLERLVAVVLALLTVSGFYLGYIAPRLSVDVSGSLQAANPLAAVFQVSNDGVLPVHSVAATCGNLSAHLPNIQIVGPGERVAPEFYADTLSPGHKLTVTCGHTYGLTAPTNFTSAEMVIQVHYRPDWILWRKTATFPWKAERAQDGHWIWNSVPR